MKTIVELNSNNYGSTGTIMNNVAIEARKQGYNVITSCKKSRKAMSFNYDNQIYVGTWLDRIISERLAELTGLHDHFNIINTALYIKQLKKIKPDLIHIHSLVGSYINIGMLFKYIKNNNIPVVWTFHDVWAMTGKCIFFDYVKCDKWVEGCKNCPQLHRQPNSLLFDTSNYLWKKKKEWFSNVNNLTVVTPSKWLSNIDNKSFFKNYPVKVINNGIDRNIFKYTDSNFRKENNLEDKYIVLGVAYNWVLRKGTDIFVELAKRLPNNYQIVMVGTNDEIDKTLPKNIISIHRTYSQKELAEIYSCADVFVNPTREDNFPTVNMEAIACGLPVITFNTGGSPEIIDDTCGKVVDVNDIDSLEKQIINVCENKIYSKQDCIKYSEKYDNIEKYKEYIKLFDEILEKH